MTDYPIGQLKLHAAVARRLVIRMIRAGGAGHVGGALSSIDIVTALYFAEMNVDPADPSRADRDRFLLSAGHKALSQYAVLACRGFIPAEWLDTYGAVGSKLGGHPDMHKVPGVEANTGALGHGLAIAGGMALGLRAAGTKARVYTILGDGELPEGANWEAASIASHFELDNLVAFIDVNDLQISGRTRDVMNMHPIPDKFAAFGWTTITIDGNDVASIVDALAQARRVSGPVAVIALTVKGKGISAIEDTLGSHYWMPDAAQLAAAEAELNHRIAELERQFVGVLS